jgi:hypothetical protein
LIYDFSYRIGGQNACFAIGNGIVQNFAENKGEITGISFQKVGFWFTQGSVDGTAKSVWFRQVFGLLRVR